ncbi:MAG TPA: TetR/AcrR family transcriptional regulator [Spirochaetota bacterium]|nr:TetR/AcrR family transcriptional regulator [Spirochaetota bacterium]HPJ37167.1 TetR/AcrR family transcriptional regulator [Spirochaetota bacterium]HPQ51708.1 TetR/AcrR family transcriptional regulator [Spirochaetota bacterium]
MNKADRKNHIIHCAKELFVSKGFHNTSITDIVDQANIARSTFYAHFDNKMDIFSILVDTFSGILLNAILGINISKAEKQRELTDEIKAMTIVLVDAFENNRDLASLLITAPQGHDNNFDRKISEFYSAILQAIRTLLVEGIEGNTIKKLEPDITSYAILGSIKQILIQWLIYEEIENIYEVLDDIIKFHLYGISA